MRTSARDCRACSGTGGRLRQAAPECPWAPLCVTDPEGCACAALAARGPARLQKRPAVPVEVHRLRTQAEREAALAVWQAVVQATAYGDVAKHIAGALLHEVTCVGAEELLHCLERLHDATTSALVVVRAELRDELHPAQLQLELGGGER